MNDLYEIIYVSHRRADISDRIIIDEIVLPSGLRNRRFDITGVLWFSATRFLQIIEGERSKVESLFGLIKSDNRHHSITLISACHISQRSFTRWGMRALTGDQEDGIDQLVARYTPESIGRGDERPQVKCKSHIGNLRSSLVKMAAAEPVLD